MHNPERIIIWFHLLVFFLKSCLHHPEWIIIWSFIIILPHSLSLPLSRSRSLSLFLALSLSISLSRSRSLSLFLALSLSISLCRSRFLSSSWKGDQFGSSSPHQIPRFRPSPLFLILLRFIHFFRKFLAFKLWLIPFKHGAHRSLLRRLRRSKECPGNLLRHARLRSPPLLLLPGPPPIQPNRRTVRLHQLPNTLLPCRLLPPPRRTKTLFPSRNLVWISTNSGLSQFLMPNLPRN